MPCSEELKAAFTKECCNLGLDFFAHSGQCKLVKVTRARACPHTVGVGGINTVREPSRQQKAGGAAYLRWIEVVSDCESPPWDVAGAAPTSHYRL